MESMSEFTNQNLAMTAWSLATLEVCDCPLLSSIAAEAIPRIGDFDPQHLSIIAWAYALLGFICKVAAVIVALRGACFIYQFAAIDIVNAR